MRTVIVSNIVGFPFGEVFVDVKEKETVTLVGERYVKKWGVFFNWKRDWA